MDNTSDIFNLNTPEGRKAAREARKRLNREKHARDQLAKRMNGPANPDHPDHIPRCAAKKRNGYPCKSLSDPTNPDPSKQIFCKYHAANAEQQAQMIEQANLLHRMKRLKPHELMRRVVESNPLAFMQPYLDALGIRVVFIPDQQNPDIMHPVAVQDPTSNGTTLFGISKDGRVIVSKHKDIEAQQRAVERLFDRVYGKPKQTSIISTDTSDPNQYNIIPFDQQRQNEVAAILQAAKKPSHQLPENSQN